MVVCKFFLQGNCKFGDFCKFEHQLNDNFNNYQNTTSILRQSQFGNTQQQTKNVANPSSVDTNTLVKSVVNDMAVAEKGGQWLLSCYAPFKEKPAFPGFEDYSFEEIRFGNYEAVKNGTVEQYKQQVQMLLQQAIMRNKSLQSPSPDIVNLLKCIYNTPPSSHCGVYGSNTNTSTTAFGNVENPSGAFGHQQTAAFGHSPSMFAQSNQSVFGKTTQSQNQFGNTSNIFGGNVSQSQVFGGHSNSVFGTPQSQPQNTTNIFRQANTNFTNQVNSPLFGGQSVTTQAINSPIFNRGQSTNTVQKNASSVFGGPQNISSFGSQPLTQPTPGNIFSNTFAAQNTGSTFGQNPQNMFGASPTAQVNQTFGTVTTVQNIPSPIATNVFGIGNSQPQTQNLIFGQQPSLFSQQNVSPSFNQQNSNSAFGQLPSNVGDAKNHSNSIFGTQSIVPSNPPIVQVPQMDETAYSKLEELSEDDIKWFESDDLDIFKIPEKPPAFQMCFKT